jgi:hypothetical protein
MMHDALVRDYTTGCSTPIGYKYILVHIVEVETDGTARRPSVTLTSSILGPGLLVLSRKVATVHMQRAVQCSCQDELE